MPSGSIPHGTQRPQSGKPHGNDVSTPQELPDESYEGTMAAQNAPYMGVIPGRAITDRRLSAFQFRVFTLMCGYANTQTRICWPKQETLARLLDTNVQVISKIIAQLIKLGYVEVNKYGFPARNVYRIIWETPQEPTLPHRVVSPDKSELSPQTSQSCLPRQVNNSPIEQTIRTSSSERVINQPSLAQSAETAPPTVTAPPARRTRGSVDSSSLKRDPLYIALTQYLPEPVTPGEWRQWFEMISRLHRAQVSDAEIPQAIKGHQLLMPNAHITLPSIERHWSEIREGKSREQFKLAHATRQTQQRHTSEAAQLEERFRQAREAAAQLERELGIRSDG